MKNYTKKWGYNVIKTKFPGVYKKMEGGFVVRARVQTPTGHQKEILKSGDWSTEVEALGWLADEKKRVRQGTPLPPQVPCLSVFAEALLEEKLSRAASQKGRILSASGQMKWRIRLVHLLGGVDKTVEGKRYAVQGLGDVPLDRLFGPVRTFKDECHSLINDGVYSPVTINGWFTILKTVTKEATKRYRLGEDPMQGFEDFCTDDVNTYPPGAPNAVPPNEVERLLDLVMEHWPQHCAMIFLGFATGLRPSSLRSLRRKGPESDVLWDVSKLWVRRSATMGTIMNTTKTKRHQLLGLHERVVDILKWHIDTQLNEAQEESELLFPSEEGGLRADSVLRRPFRDLTERMALGYRITPRSMRRTFNDISREAGVRDEVTRSISGHQSDLMQRHYSSISSEEQVEAQGCILRVIGGGKSQVVGKVVGDPSQVVGEKEKPATESSATG